MAIKKHSKSIITANKKHFKFTAKIKFFDEWQKIKMLIKSKNTTHRIFGWKIVFCVSKMGLNCFFLQKKIISSKLDLNEKFSILEKWEIKHIDSFSCYIKFESRTEISTKKLKFLFLVRKYFMPYFWFVECKYRTENLT